MMSSETANVQLNNLCVDESDPPRDCAPLAREEMVVKGMPCWQRALSEGRQPEPRWLDEMDAGQYEGADAIYG
ncbi:hypothetical protein [Altererythrobacter sp.]|uniref:hypothetical protein n=1 Tax=Altererythrobacter sp. TaxID=1872480 RepID=UPI001B1F6A66|nr:hypothetical protein [Altererythrobacter sp.]MBO6610458.1 hypothetical protein [Altererythrobacter sp.]MBO6641750.1 hypothetical protein [Altererythrobacter sp.]MBO6707551.1 hypothetical protein [Altererythrobacter sp.]MBO6946317.1 hypothetical protein [Altererythrobacter sp.]